nr:unnamed protein product [Callosobruchus analis]
MHLRKAEVFITKLSEVQKSADPSEMMICFDFEKNLPLPVTNAQDEYYVSQLWFHVFGIHNLKNNKTTCTRRTLLTKDRMRKQKPFEVVFVQHSLRANGEIAPCDRILKINDYKQWLMPYIKTSVPGLSKIRFIRFQSGKPVQSRESMTGTCTDTSLYKVGMNRKISTIPKLAYGDSYLPIKPKKFQSITKLLKMVTSGDIEFYRRTLINPVSVIIPGRNDTEDGIESDADIYE